LLVTKRGVLTIIGNKLKKTKFELTIASFYLEAIMITLGNKINNSNGPAEAP